MVTIFISINKTIAQVPLYIYIHQHVNLKKLLITITDFYLI